MLASFAKPRLNLSYGVHEQRIPQADTLSSTNLQVVPQITLESSQQERYDAEHGRALQHQNDGRQRSG